MSNDHSFMNQSYASANVLSLSTKVCVAKTAWCLHCVRILCSRKQLYKVKNHFCTAIAIILSFTWSKTEASTLKKTRLVQASFKAPCQKVTPQVQNKWTKLVPCPDHVQGSHALGPQVSIFASPTKVSPSGTATPWCIRPSSSCRTHDAIAT